MKIFLLADGSSAHTERWVNALVEKGVNVYLFSLNYLSEEMRILAETGQVQANDMAISVESSTSYFRKAAYLKVLPQLKKELHNFKPDLLHAHYISSYGLLAYLSGFKPYVLSVWGSDLMVFPKNGFIQKKIIQAVLKSASMVYSSSQLMLKELQEVYKIDASMQIPFGVDLSVFFPATEKDKETFTFVIVKTLMPTYGIDIAIQAFIMLLDKYPNEQIQLNIYGGGEERENYEALAGIYLGKKIHFYGKVPRDRVPEILGASHVLINISRYESFGVSVLEAAATALPAIVSNRGGLPETVIANETAIVLDDLTQEDCFKAMEEYFLNREKYKEHAKKARSFVEKNYDEIQSVKAQLEAYEQIMIKNK